jgi:hypothetical protein
MSDHKNLINEFLSGGWIILIVGASGMGARILCSGIRHSAYEIFKRILAASLCSGIAWFVLEQTELASLTKAIVYGVVGVVSPELINGLIKIAARFAKNPIKFFDDNKSN